MVEINLLDESFKMAKVYGLCALSLDFVREVNLASRDRFDRGRDPDPDPSCCPRKNPPLKKISAPDYPTHHFCTSTSCIGSSTVPYFFLPCSNLTSDGHGKFLNSVSSSGS